MSARLQYYALVTVLQSLAFILLTQFIHAQLIRDRSVQCNSNEMLVTFEFSQPFNGVIYANKFYQTKSCRWEGNGSRRLQTAVPLTTNQNNQGYCGVQLKESGGEFTVTLLISPMKGLLVEGMDMIIIKCLYTTGDVTLTISPGTNGAGIQISPHTQGSVVTGSGGSPFLQMAIRDGHGINNDVIQVAQVGQRITLDIVMRDTTIYDFYVHDCYAHDGTNTPEASISIIDQNGCAVRLNRAVDVPVFTTAPVPNGAKHVYVHMYGFQFTTSQFVYFECQVRPCLQSCNRPQCILPSTHNSTKTSARSRRAAVLESEADTEPSTLLNSNHDNYNLTTVIRVEPQELVAFTPGASSLSRNAKSAYDNQSKCSSSNAEVCVHTTVAIALLIIFVLVCVVSLSIAIFVCHKAQKDDDLADESAGNYCSSNSSSTTENLGGARKRFGQPLPALSVDNYCSVSPAKFGKTSRRSNADNYVAIRH